MKNSSPSRQVLLEALLKPIESKLANELGLILEDIYLLTSSSNTSRDVLKFAIKLEATGMDSLKDRAWPRGSPCREICGSYEPETGKMVIHVDCFLEKWSDDILSRMKTVESTLWYLLIRHLQHTAPHLTISGHVPESMDKPTAWEMEACMLSDILANLFQQEGLDLFGLVISRTFPLVKTLLQKPLGRGEDCLTGRCDTNRPRDTPLNEVKHLAIVLERDLDKLRYFVLNKPIVWELANDSGLDWKIYVASLRLSRDIIGLASPGGRIVLEYSKSKLRTYWFDWMEIVLEEPVEVNTSRLMEVVFHPGHPEPHVELAGRDWVVEVKARIKPDPRCDEPLVFGNLGEAIAELSKAKIPVELPKPECQQRLKRSELVYTLPRQMGSRENVYRLTSIRLMLPPDACREDEKSRGFARRS